MICFSSLTVMVINECVAQTKENTNEDVRKCDEPSQEGSQSVSLHSTCWHIHQFQFMCGERCIYGGYTCASVKQLLSCLVVVKLKVMRRECVSFYESVNICAGNEKHFYLPSLPKSFSLYEPYLPPFPTSAVFTGTLCRVQVHCSLVSK